MAYTDWDTDPADNNSIGAVGIGPNMPIGNVDNAFRELIAQLAAFRDYLDGLIGSTDTYQPKDATLTALAALTTAADKLPYATGSDTFGTTDFTAFGRTLVALANAPALRTTLGAVTVTGASLSATGYITLDISGTPLTIQWGTGTWATPTSFATNFATACWAVVPVTTSLIGESDEADEILYVSSKSVSGFTTAIKGDYSSAPTLNYIAIGS